MRVWRGMMVFLTSALAWRARLCNIPAARKMKAKCSQQREQHFAFVLRAAGMSRKRAPSKSRGQEDQHATPRPCNRRPIYHHSGPARVSRAHDSRGRGCRGSRGLDQHTARKQYAAPHSALCQPCDAARPSASALVMSGTGTASGRGCSGIIYLSAGEQRQPGASSTCVQFRPNPLLEWIKAY